MPKFTKQKAHLNRLALDKKNNSSSGNENQLETNLEQFSRYVICGSNNVTYI